MTRKVSAMTEHQVRLTPLRPTKCNRRTMEFYAKLMGLHLAELYFCLFSDDFSI